VEIDRETARRLLTMLTPAQFRMVELLADHERIKVLQARFGGCHKTVVLANLREARATCGVETNADLVKLWQAAQ
jgi:hypothetical protein